MSKHITIIDTYAPTEDKQNLLVSCIESCKKLNTDILLVSHCTLPEHIVSMVDYYIFDKDNRFNVSNTFAWKVVNNVTVNLRINQSHEFPIIKSMRNAFSLAHALKYEYFYFTEFDFLFSDNDIEKLKSLQNELQQTNKNFVFMKPDDASWIMNDVQLYGIYYETSFFAGRVEPLLQRFNEYFPFTIEEYNSSLALMLNGKPGCLEHLFYDAFHGKTDESIIIPQYVKEYLSESKTNTSSFKSTTSLILPSNIGKNYLYISNDNAEEMLFRVYMNDVEVEQHNLINASVAQSFRLVELQDTAKIRVDVYSNNKLINVHNVEYDVNFADYSNNGTVEIL